LKSAPYLLCRMADVLAGSIAVAELKLSEMAFAVILVSDPTLFGFGGWRKKGLKGVPLDMWRLGRLPEIKKGLGFP
jgi:hypothetical protein